MGPNDLCLLVSMTLYSLFRFSYLLLTTYTSQLREGGTFMIGFQEMNQTALP